MWGFFSYTIPNIFTWHATSYQLLRSCTQTIVYTAGYSDWEVENINMMCFP